MKRHRPHGPAPTALEANVLKLRALEMVLIIFYMEDLRRFIIKAVTVTNKFLQKSPSPSEDEADELGSRILRQATKELLDAGVLTKDQRTEFNKLVAYRNTIGHEPHFLTVDVGAYEDLAQLIATGKKHPSGYDSSMLERVMKMRQHLHRAVAKKFMMESSFDSLMFEAAEKSYLTEIKRLQTKISSQLKKLKSKLDEANESINKIPKQVMEEAYPCHPKHYKKNGNLSASGIECVRKLYQAGATPLAVSHLMKISIVAAKRWK